LQLDTTIVPAVANDNYLTGVATVVLGSVSIVVPITA
jgi:hypothetical protein